MSFQDDLAADVANVFGNAEEFGQTASYRPRGAATTFNLIVTFGDPDESVQQMQAGQSVDRVVRAMVSLAVVRAGIAVIEVTARDPGRGDLFTIASGADAGTWVVQDAVPDLGGAVQLTVSFDRQRIYGAEGATQVR